MDYQKSSKHLGFHSAVHSRVAQICQKLKIQNIIYPLEIMNLDIWFPKSTKIWKFYACYRDYLLNNFNFWQIWDSLPRPKKNSIR